MDFGGSRFQLGKGISVRRSFLPELVKRAQAGDSRLCSSLDWVEIVPENFMERGGAIRRALLHLADCFPVALHGVSLSIGSSDPLNEDYLNRLVRLANEVESPWVSDHLCFSSAQGTELHQLLPLPFTREVASYVADRVRQVQSRLKVPFALENPSYYLTPSGSDMTEAQFIAEVLEKSDGHLLLDLNNVWVNCLNHQPEGIDRVDLALDRARSFLRQLPLERVIEVHVAGFDRSEHDGFPFLLDTHGSSVSDGVRTLIQDLDRLCPLQNLLLEREQNVPPLDRLLDELDELWALKANPAHTDLAYRMEQVPLTRHIQLEFDSEPNPSLK